MLPVSCSRLSLERWSVQLKSCRISGGGGAGGLSNLGLYYASNQVINKWHFYGNKGKRHGSGGGKLETQCLSPEYCP